MIAFRQSVVVLLFAFASPVAAARAQGACETPAGVPGVSRDLYCIELVTASGAGAARGTAQLDWIPSPFTVGVAPDGTHRWDLTFSLEGLPPLPRGRRTGFVAWATSPSMTPMVRLGTVRPGTTRVGPVAFDRFLILISAESDTTTTERRGPLVLRGESAGLRMRPADTYQFFLGALGAPPTRSDSSGHAGHRAAGRDSAGWTDVPMYPGLDMLPSEMALRPPVRPWQPEDDPAAPGARTREVVRVADGDSLELTAGVVNRTIAGRRYTMFGFNGQYPGPLLMVPEGAEITVRFTNRLPLPSTVHWHGLRLDARFDGVPEVSQAPVEPGGTFTYRLRFPDGGMFWYHPHVRDDVQQDLGLYGNIFVRPSAPDAYGRAHREEFLILDDLLVGTDGLVPWGLEAPTHAAMGRFGNVMLVNGEPDWRLRVRPGEVVRFFLTNASGTRTFNLGFGPGVRMKVVGSDLGTYSRETWVESVVIAPAERYVVEARFGAKESTALVNRVRAIDHLYARFLSEVDTLGLITVEGADASPDLAADFATLREAGPARAEMLALVRAHQGRPPDRTLELRVAFAGLPFVSERLMRIDSAFFNPVEWAGTMPGMNWATTGTQAHWMLRDPTSGAENMALEWRFKRGEKVRIRLVNSREVLHGMQHPIHLHGQRFLILAVNGTPNPNPVWKDTVLVPAGGAVDLLVDLSNPGRWMLHCHIAEHLQAGMMTVINVEES
ncbi:MAG TPA: multicopper oxidase family protein [Gemmatimonadales bacterium]|nr:multicopper oxidase family protein [Gemmatimonadales bacterium]